MKKLIFILMVLCASIVSTAQTNYRIYATDSAFFDGTDFVYGEIHKSTMTLTIKEQTAVLVNGQTSSTYYIYKEIDSNSFFAHDEKDKKCIIYFDVAYKSAYIEIIYTTFKIRYYYL
jgi:hypothetical protein